MSSTIDLTTNKEFLGDSACGCQSGGCRSSSREHTDNFELPGRFQLVSEGDRVVELGSGTGDDAQIAASAVGTTGKVIGIDNNALNIDKARMKADSMQVNNLEFRHGDIEAIPVADEYADVIFATCVFNLQRNKQKVADEMYRICRHNGFVCVSDFVILTDIPEGLRQEAAEIAGSIRGAEDVNSFMDYFRKTGFANGGIVEVNKVQLPEDLLAKYLDPAMTKKYNDPDSDEGIFNVVLVAEKPETCNPATCCHNQDKHKN